jgi:CO/xanthine dehydrogenase Mo-binding subunit
VARYWIAWALGVPESRVRAIKPMIGGAFGGKVDVFPHDVCPAKFAQMTGHPVKCVLKRDEVFIATRTRHPIAFQIETAFTKDGTLLAKRAKHVLDGGAYGGSGNAANALSLIVGNLPYRFPNVDMSAQRIYTDKPPSGAMRGYSACQVDFAHETHMDEAAEALGIDPLELRRKNGAVPGYTSPTGLRVTSCAFDESLVVCCREIGWEKRNSLPHGEGIGLGGSCFMSGTGFPILVTPHYSSNSTLVRLNREGYATVFTGANDIGQGSDTVMAMIVAEELGLRMEDVKCVMSDTTLTPWDSGSYGSRVTFLAGNGCRRAAGDAKLKLLSYWADEWGCKPDEITMKDRRVFIKGNAERSISYNEAVFGYEEKNFGRSCDGVGSYAHEGGDQQIQKTNHGNYAPAYSFSSCTAKVKVDLETGELTMQDFVFAHDCGRALNRRAVEGQIEGSVLLGLGFTCYEECQYDEAGRHRNPNFRDYRFPTALDMPPIRSFLVGEPDPEGPMGAKEAGEGTTAPVGPAIANAIANATGVHFHSLPISSERIWRAMRDMKGSGAASRHVGDEGLAEKFAAMPKLRGLSSEDLKDPH